jgi:hypothetical protein
MATQIEKDNELNYIHLQDVTSVTAGHSRQPDIPDSHCTNKSVSLPQQSCTTKQQILA